MRQSRVAVVLALIGSSCAGPTGDGSVLDEGEASLQATLVARGAVWSYLDNGSDQGTAWRAPGFADSTWRTGPAELGYGDGDERTVVSYGPNASNKYVTTYFRRGFEVADTSIYSALTLGLRRDDGAVVYLNGVEVFRTAMPTGTITYTTLSNAYTSETQYFTTSVPLSQLVAGHNVLAVEVHQADRASSDISFNLYLVATLRDADSGPPAPDGGSPMPDAGTATDSGPADSGVADSGLADTGVADSGGGSLGGSLPALLPPSTGTTYYVSTTGSDSAAGTLSSPWRTIQKALDTLHAGEQALVRGGTYTQDLEMSRAGTSSAPITVAAYPGETAVLRAASTSGDTYPIQIMSGAAYFRLRGFVIERAIGTSSTNVYLSGSANHIELSSNDIRYSQDQGIFVERTTSYVWVLGNRIHDNGLGHVSGQHQSHGIYIEGHHDLIANNVIYNHPYGFGIQIYPANHDTVVVDNTVVHSAHSAIVVGGSGGVSNITIRNNILAFNGVYGIEMDACPTGFVLVDHNVIFANPDGAVEPGCSAVNTSGGNRASDPLFVSDASRDLHLQAGSPAVDYALGDYSMTVDADGVARPRGPAADVGAFER